MNTKTEINVALCLMSDAVDGPAIAYWAEARNVKRAPDLTVISFDVRDGGFEAPRESEEWVRIDESKVRQAAQDLRDGKADIHRRIAAQFVGNDWEYDAEGTDCLIQYATFGKVVFG